MVKRSLHLFIFIIFFSISFVACSSGQNATSQETGQDTTGTNTSVDPFEQNRKLGRGIDLGNALEAPAEGEWGMTIQENYIQLIEDAGFNSVRIPTRWNAHAAETSPYTIQTSFFNRVDEVIEWSLERDLYVVLNIHHYNSLMENPRQQKERFLSIWRQIAEHYADYPDSLILEVLNEPHGNLTPDLWNQYLRDAIETIRESNPGRTIMIGTAPWGGISGLQDLSVPEDDRNIIVTVHYYEPFQFTHQGAEWVENADNWLGTMWTGTEHQKEAVEEDFDAVKNWAEQHNRPIYVGEFGAYRAAPMESREAWTSFVRQTMEERAFSWAYWEFGAGFGVYDRENSEWRTGLLEALIPDSPELD